MWVEALGMGLAVAIIVASGVIALPWTDAEVRSSVRAFGTVAALPWLVARAGRRRAVSAPWA